MHRAPVTTSTRATRPRWGILSEEDIADQIVTQVTKGFGDTGMRAGIIGEIGFQSGTPAEEKSLRGAGMAQQETGAALNVHVPFGIGLGRTSAIGRRTSSPRPAPT